MATRNAVRPSSAGKVIDQTGEPVETGFADYPLRNLPIFIDYECRGPAMDAVVRAQQTTVDHDRECIAPFGHQLANVLGAGGGGYRQYRRFLRTLSIEPIEFGHHLPAVHSAAGHVGKQERLPSVLIQADDSAVEGNP